MLAQSYILMLLRQKTRFCLSFFRLLVLLVLLGGGRGDALLEGYMLR